MKRHVALREFSDDHHQGLVNARRLREASIADAARAFLEFWRADTRLHFRKEEEVLLPVLDRYGGDPGEPPVADMLVQHARIRGLVLQLGDEVEQEEVLEETLGALGESLEAHIRLEEREVFPLVEQTLPEDALGEISALLNAFDAGTLHEQQASVQSLSFGPWPGPGNSEGRGTD